MVEILLEEQIEGEVIPFYLVFLQGNNVGDRRVNNRGSEYLELLWLNIIVAVARTIFFFLLPDILGLTVGNSFS